MHFLLVGATGRTGKHVLAEVLSQGHTAVALIRRNNALPQQPGLTVVVGSPLDKGDIARALLAAPGVRVDAAITTLNTVRESDSPFAAQVSPPRLLADSCAALCAALREHGTKRIIIMSTAGVGDSRSGLPWISRAFMGWTNIKHALADHNLVDVEVRVTGMHWTLVRAVKLDYAEPMAAVGAASSELEILSSKGPGARVSDSANVVRVAQYLVKVAAEELSVGEAVVVRDRRL